MNYCIECKKFHFNTLKKAFECSSGIVRISEIPCDSYVKDSMVWVKMPRSHGRLVDLDAFLEARKHMATWEEYLIEDIDNYFENHSVVVMEASE